MAMEPQQAIPMTMELGCQELLGHFGPVYNLLQENKNDNEVKNIASVSNLCLALLINGCTYLCNLMIALSSHKNFYAGTYYSISFCGDFIHENFNFWDWNWRLNP